MPTNQFLQFCPTDTGTNLVAQADYAVDDDRVSGQKPGAASSALNNKALRQANFITSQVAQYLADTENVDVLDDGLTTKAQAIIRATFDRLLPQVSQYTSGSGTHNLTYAFFVSGATADAGATYTNNGVTFTVKKSISSGSILYASGSGAPLANGTLTRSGGPGDNTITFYAYRKPLFLKLKGVAGGGGGAGSGASAGSSAGAGGDSTFGGVITLKGGSAGTFGAAGATGGSGGSLGSLSGSLITGGGGGGGANGAAGSAGGVGGNGIFGGGGASGSGSAGVNAAANTGGGGGGGGNAGGTPGAGGGAGEGCDSVIVPIPSGNYAYAVGAAGSAGGAGSSGGQAGGAGAAGRWIIEEYFQ